MIPASRIRRGGSEPLRRRRAGGLSVAGFAALSLLAAPLGLAQAPAAPAVDPNGPRLMLAEDKKDAGTVPLGEPIRQTFTVRNTGKADLHITDVKASCGCTAPEYDKVVKPGGEGKITLAIDTKTFRQGPVTKTALVVSDDPVSPQARLVVNAVIKPYVEALPNGYFRVQTLAGDPVTVDQILVSDEPDFKPTKAEAALPYLKVDLQPVPEKDRIPNRNPNQYKLSLTASPDTPEGLLGGYVKVTTGVKKQPEADVAISGYVKQAVSVNPFNVNFGNFETKGDPVKRTVTVQNNNTKNEAFAVTKAETTVQGVSAEVVPTGDKWRVQVVLTVDKKTKVGTFDGQLIVRTNDPSRGEIKVPIKGTVLPPT